ncbi:hypothetical protein NOCA2140028 [metagenome]|uniref:STAS domain-containing protein n=1 Tax=metagenome TaxID=256318 RepID=A0A2P2BWT4_9ZZZZ
MITACLAIDLTKDHDDYGNSDRRALTELMEVPDGATAIVDIGARQFVSQDLASMLHEHGDRITIEIRGTDTRSLIRFVKAARDGYWSVTA